MSKSKYALPIVASLGIAGCSSSGGNSALTFSELADEGVRLESVLGTSSATPSSAFAGLASATYKGVARILETEESVSALDATTLSYVAGAEVTINVNFGTNDISGSADNFFELEDPNADIAMSAGEPISGNFTVTPTSVEGTITKLNGEVANYSLLGSYGFFGDNAELLAGEATGTSSASGRADLNAAGEVVAEKQ